MGQEIWKDIPGYRGIYQVSTLGRVRSRYRRGMKRALFDSYRYLKPSKGGNGYSIVHLYLDKRRTAPVHRLMHETFFSEDARPQINHINGIKTDNRIENLEPCTASENLKHAHRTGLSPRPPMKRKLTDGQVMEIFNLKGSRGVNIPAAKRYGVNASVICRIRNGKAYSFLTRGRGAE